MIVSIDGVHDDKVASLPLQLTGSIAGRKRSLIINNDAH
jgi:hypothetical protein